MDKRIINFLVSFPHYQQKIFIGNGIELNVIKVLLSHAYDKFLILVDHNAYNKFFRSVNFLQKKLHASLIQLNVKNYKDYQKAYLLIDKIFKFGINRKSCLLVVGGGSLGDLAGFVSSIYMRGIDMAYMPTTFMSQADSIIGKVAVNINREKNLVGSFFSPAYTFCDLQYLKQLKFSKHLYGLVEIWKHAIVKHDQKLLKIIEDSIVNKTIDQKDLIYQSLKIKAYFVKQDPYDSKGIHKALSLGHTTANFLERNKKFNHGEAVFYGIALAAFISKGMGIIHSDNFESLTKNFDKFHKYINKDREFIDTLYFRKFLKHLNKDKINSHGQYSFVVPTNKGYEIVKNIDQRIILKSIKNLKIFLRSKN